MGSKLSPIDKVAFALDAVQGNSHLLRDLSPLKATIGLTTADFWPIKLSLRCSLSLFLSFSVNFHSHMYSTAGSKMVLYGRRYTPQVRRGFLFFFVLFAVRYNALQCNAVSHAVVLEHESLYTFSKGLFCLYTLSYF